MIKSITIFFSKRFTKVIALILCALFSAFILTDIVSSSSLNATTMQSLDDKKARVVRLLAASTVTSTTLSLLPGDIASPIAEEIADLSSYFIVILSAILLEKILLSMVGLLSFGYIIPFACALYIVYLFTKKENWLVQAKKWAIFAMVIVVTIPAAMRVSDYITESYQHSIDQTIVETEQNTQTIEQAEKDLAAQDKNWIEKVGNSIADFTSSIGSGVGDMVKAGEESLGAFIDAISILIITCCVIPVAILLVFAFVIKSLFGVDIRPQKRIWSANQTVQGEPKRIAEASDNNIRKNDAK